MSVREIFAHVVSKVLLIRNGEDGEPCVSIDINPKAAAEHFLQEQKFEETASCLGMKVKVECGTFTKEMNAETVIRVPLMLKIPIKFTFLMKDGEKFFFLVPKVDITLERKETI